MMRARVHRRFEPFSDLTLEAFLCDELPAHEAQMVERVMQASPELRSYIAERRAERAAFLLLHPNRAVLATPSPRRLSWSWAFAGAGALACALVFAALVPLAETSGPESALIRAKGGLSAGLVVQRDGRVFDYADGILLRPGDKVRLMVSSSSGGFLTLLGHDRDGFSIYYDATPIPGGSFTAPGSLVLDETPGPEYWYVIVAPDRVAAKDYIALLRSGGTPASAATVLKVVKEITP